MPILLVRQVDALFDMFDKDRSGSVDYRELTKSIRRRTPGGDLSSVRDGSGTAMMKATAAVQHVQSDPDRAKVLYGTTLSADSDIVAELAAALNTNWAKVSDLFHEVSSSEHALRPPRVCIRV